MPGETPQFDFRQDPAKLPTKVKPATVNEQLEQRRVYHGYVRCTLDGSLTTIELPLEVQGKPVSVTADCPYGHVISFTGVIEPIVYKQVNLTSGL